TRVQSASVCRCDLQFGGGSIRNLGADDRTRHDPQRRWTNRPRYEPCPPGRLVPHKETIMAILRPLVFATFFTATAIAASAQAQAQSEGNKTITKQNKVTATVTIRAIDQATRSITLRSENGDEDTFTVGPDVERFNQLKVGDKIRVTYYEA